MSVSQNLAVQHHQQDTDYYCGAACAQMVLETIGAGLLDQDDLYADNHSHSVLDGTGWATAPDGLQWTLNDRRPASFANYFALFALGYRRLDLAQALLDDPPLPGRAGRAGLRLGALDHHPRLHRERRIRQSVDNSYSISAFDVNNPWPPAPSFYTPALAPPPPHSASDGCGTGGDRGIANEHITYSTWQSTYMTGVPGGYWNGKFVAVCDPEPPSERGGPRNPNPPRRGDGRLSRPAARPSSRFQP